MIITWVYFVPSNWNFKFDFTIWWTIANKLLVNCAWKKENRVLHAKGLFRSRQGLRKYFNDIFQIYGTSFIYCHTRVVLMVSYTIDDVRTISSMATHMVSMGSGSGSSQKWTKIKVEITENWSRMGRINYSKKTTYPMKLVIDLWLQERLFSQSEVVLNCLQTLNYPEI